jgi:hypothetical protein
MKTVKRFYLGALPSGKVLRDERSDLFHLRLPHEAQVRVFVAAQLRRQKLQSDLTLEDGVTGPVDHTHSDFAALSPRPTRWLGIDPNEWGEPYWVNGIDELLAEGRESRKKTK